MIRLIDTLAAGVTDDAGAPLASGTVTTYLAGTTTLYTVYQDFELSNPHPNPATLDAAGRLIAYADTRVKLVIATSAGVTVRTVDNVGNADSDIVPTTQPAQLTAYTTDAAFVSAKGSPAANGDVYPNTTDNSIHYFTNSNWRATTYRRSVKDPAYGAVGDGVTSDYAAIAAAIAVGAGEIYLPPGTYYIGSHNLAISTANTRLTGDGRGSKLIFDAGYGIRITASYCEIDHIWVHGTAYTSGSHVNGEQLIGATGVSAASPNTGLSIHDCWITEASMYGIFVEWMSMVDIRNNYIQDIYYAGIAIQSCTSGKVCHNEIRDILGSSSGNSYGVFFSRQAGSLATYPRCSDFICDGNFVTNNPTWEALDTHAGQQITFSNNVIYSCKFGIVVGPHSDGYAPLQCVVSNNSIDSGVTDGSFSPGIQVVGSLGHQNADACIVSGNTIKGHGDSTASGSGAILIACTKGLSIVGNSIITPSPRAIVSYDSTNYGISIVGNNCIDAWTNTVGVGEAGFLRMVGDNHTGIIANNSQSTSGDKSATYLSTMFSRFDSAATGVVLIIQGNGYTNASKFVINACSGLYVENSNNGEFDAGNSSTAITINWTDGNAQKVTMTGNCTFALSKFNSGKTITLRLLQDATGSRTYTWPATVKWEGGVAPTGSGANKTDIVQLYFDGTNYIGRFFLNA